MTTPYDYEALWLKAKLFLNRAMDETIERPFDERALWASLALELLAKAALARVSPLLIAEPNEEGTNLLIASGLMEGEARFNSVRAATIYARCKRAFKPFDEAEAKKVTHARNEYLHGATAGFTAIPASAWWPSFWNQAIILTTALDRTIEDLVGQDRSHVVERHLAQNKRNIEHRAEMLIERARTRLAQWQAGTLPAKVAAEWKPRVTIVSGEHEYHESAPCPACGDSGVLEGSDTSDVRVEYQRFSEEDYDAQVEVDVYSEYFSCGRCGLVLDDFQLLEQAGLDTTFTTEGSAEDVDLGDAYGND